jgi:hypothetical protein
MLRYLFFPSLFLLLIACNQNEPAGFFAEMTDAAVPVNYQRNDLEKMHWLSGDWQGQDEGKKLLRSFRLLVDHGQTTLQTAPGAPVFSWHNERWYYGTNHQWVLSWVGEKDLRFEPNVAGVPPMTWTRVSDTCWHLIRHLPQGDEVVEMTALHPLPS